MVFRIISLNFGMSDGNFTGMGGHEGLCRMGSLINLDKSGKSKVAWKVLEEISTQNGPPKKNNKIIVKIIK